MAMDTVPDKTPPLWITEALARSEAEIAAGKIAPLEPVLDRLRASITRMQAKDGSVEPRRARKT
jgi:hypothetical protein